MGLIYFPALTVRHRPVGLSAAPPHPLLPSTPRTEARPAIGRLGSGLSRIGVCQPGPRCLKRGRGGAAVPARRTCPRCTPSQQRSQPLSLSPPRVSRSQRLRRAERASLGKALSRPAQGAQSVWVELCGRRCGHHGSHLPAGGGFRHELRGLDWHHRHNVHQ